MENTRTTKISPRLVYDAYPASDLLPLEPPEPNESFREYRDRITDKGLIDCGDTLFAFLMFELTHAENPQDALHLLSGAMNDILSIHAEISKRY